jgi:sugar phosphate isomerase/epimerase
MPVGSPPAKRRDDATIQPYVVHALSELAAHAASADMMLLLEPVNRYEDAHTNRLEQAAALCDEVASPALGVVADFFHMSIEESDPIVALQTFLGRVKHVHIADSNRLNPEPGTSTSRSSSVCSQERTSEGG